MKLGATSSHSPAAEVRGGGALGERPHGKQQQSNLKPVSVNTGPPASHAVFAFSSTVYEVESDRSISFCVRI